ncbi:11589_t:CDS:2 [Ambispora gerdemannii]|uniref:11589_t:CDS:1 n=1 Tax=Ambispora gerdemannii TaxID=144530 RepID=A0A9N8Z7R5_9GLOM|nr:11589_t:CDS:2 [Ambispora gerdemannii]
MICDSFKGHLEESVKKKFKECDYDLAVISDDLTSLCQLLAVAIHKPFKDNLTENSDKENVSYDDASIDDIDDIE